MATAQRNGKTAMEWWKSGITGYLANGLLDE